MCCVQFVLFCALRVFVWFMILWFGCVGLFVVYRLRCVCVWCALVCVVLCCVVLRGVSLCAMFVLLRVFSVLCVVCVCCVLCVLCFVCFVLCCVR